MYFKFLNEDGSPAHGGSGTWPLPRGNKPGKWLKVDGEILPCRNGLHLTTAEHLLEWAAPALYVAEAGKIQIDNGNKVVVQRARLLYRVEAWNNRTLRLFAADCAERALKREEKAGRAVDKRSWDVVRIARDYARGKATEQQRAAAWAAAWDAAGAAACAAARAAAGAAAGAAAWDAAGAAAGAAAGDAARAAAGDAAWDAAWAAARDEEAAWQTRRLLRYLEIETN